MEQNMLEMIRNSIDKILVGLHDSVRIIEMKTHDQYILQSSGKIIKQDIFCHQFWDRPQPCIDCVARRAGGSRCIEEKIEIYNGRIYLVMGMLIAEGAFLIETVKDITKLIATKEEKVYHCEALHQQLEQLAQSVYIDPLTGLWNRRYIDERVPLTLKKAYSLSKQVAVFMLDLDHFKQVNDNYGHTNGDQVLRWVAKIIQRGIRGRDAAVRYGGEEFAVILFDVPKEVAVRVAERIRQQVADEEVPITGGTVNVTISIGISFSEPETPMEDLLATADSRLYIAKRTGRNRVIWKED